MLDSRCNLRPLPFRYTGRRPGMSRSASGLPQHTLHPVISVEAEHWTLVTISRGCGVRCLRERLEVVSSWLVERYFSPSDIVRKRCKWSLLAVISAKEECELYRSY